MGATGEGGAGRGGGELISESSARQGEEEEVVEEEEEEKEVSFRGTSRWGTDLISATPSDTFPSLATYRHPLLRPALPSGQLVTRSAPGTG